MKHYRQCLLKRGTLTTTRWIDVDGARVGATVEVLPSREKWLVAEVFDRSLPEDVLKKTQQLNRKSLPSVEGMG